jgi:hypothetical protein
MSENKPGNKYQLIHGNLFIITPPFYNYILPENSLNKSHIFEELSQHRPIYAYVYVACCVDVMETCHSSNIVIQNVEVLQIASANKCDFQVRVMDAM